MRPPETKRRARALQVLYAWEIGGRPPLNQVVARLSTLTGPDGALLDGGDQLAQGVTGRLVEIDDLITQAAEHWRFDRIGLLERLLLRIGVHDLLVDSMPPRLAIDTTLWLTRLFLGEGAVAFVNGILDRIARELGRL